MLRLFQLSTLSSIRLVNKLLLSVSDINHIATKIRVQQMYSSFLVPIIEVWLIRLPLAHLDPGPKTRYK